MRDSVPSRSYSSVCNVLRQWKSRSSLLIESTDSMIPPITSNTGGGALLWMILIYIPPITSNTGGGGITVDDLNIYTSYHFKYWGGEGGITVDDLNIYTSYHFKYWGGEGGITVDDLNIYTSYHFKYWGGGGGHYCG